ncbi:MAG: quinolinate synthase NadA [Tepidisphaera sp.]|nr:quinolinate synthase NadA [Tepidisphaera sp.]
MLWQPSLPEAYRRMSPGELASAIDRRRRELGDRLVILGHHYQTDEIIRHADFTGDSLKLSQLAAGVAGDASRREPLKYIVFCGVHFMAESADMLAPDDVAVILPDLSAGCSMADMAQYDDTVQAWEAIHLQLNEGGAWGGRVIPITYVNSSAAIKAFVGEHGGACCTSSNALEVFTWAMNGGTKPRARGERIKVLFLPDQHLGRNTAAKFGIDVASESCMYDPKLARKGEVLGGATPAQVMESQVILWAGHCSVHKLFRPEHCDQVRAADAASGTKTTILVHPECAKEVVDKADLNGSTEYIIRQVRDANSGSRWAIGTEVHLVNRLANEAKGRGVEVRILSDCQCLCTTMYRIDEPHLLWVLDHLAGRSDGRLKTEGVKVVNQIEVLPRVKELALLALDRMLALSKPAETPLRMVTAD